MSSAPTWEQIYSFKKSTSPIKIEYCYHPWACAKFRTFIGSPFVKWRQPQCFDLAMGKSLSSAASGRQRRSVQLADLRVRQRKIINRRGSKPSGKLIACKFRAPLNKHTQSARFCPVASVLLFIRTSFVHERVSHGGVMCERCRPCKLPPSIYVFYIY